VFLCCAILSRYRPLLRADHSSKEVLQRVLIRLRNLRSEAAKVLTKTVQPLMTMVVMVEVMTMMMMKTINENTEIRLSTEKKQRWLDAGSVGHHFVAPIYSIQIFPSFLTETFCQIRIYHGTCSQLRTNTVFGSDNSCTNLHTKYCKIKIQR
jgi:hypothetical protein